MLACGSNATAVVSLSAPRKSECTVGLQYLQYRLSAILDSHSVVFTLNPIPIFPPPKGARPEAEQGPLHLHVRTGSAKSARKSKDLPGFTV